MGHPEIYINEDNKPVLENSNGNRGKQGAVSEEADCELWDSRYILRGDQEPEVGPPRNRVGPRGWCKPSCIPITIILILIVLVVLLPLLDQSESNAENIQRLITSTEQCSDPCRFSLVESIPEGLTYPEGSTPHPTTYDTWKKLISIAEKSIEIASLYWTLRSADLVPDPSSYQGQNIFDSLAEAGTKRKLKIRIAQNLPTRIQENVDTELLAKMGAGEVRSVDFPRLMGGGVLHTKLWLIDRKHVYVGSANMDWRSLTQVKELGAVVYNCSCIAEDFAKIFDVYWYLGQQSSEIPAKWPSNFSTKYNVDNPMNVTFNGSEVESFIGSSPPPFCPEGRESDITTILSVISTAQQFINIAVMDYFPLTIYSPPVKLWPVIDDALKAAAINHRVRVHLLISHWNHSRHSAPYFLRSLAAISDSYPGVIIQVKLFEVPSSPSQAKIPYARVNHNKYMVTDNTAYIGTSNWCGDYFINTGGAGLVVKDSSLNISRSDSIRSQLQAVFERDWNSRYAHTLRGS